MLSLALLAVLCVLRQSRASDIDIQGFTSGDNAPGFAIVNDDDDNSGGICVQLLRSFELSQLEEQRCNVPESNIVAGSSRDLTGANRGWTLNRISDDDMLLVNRNQATTGAREMSLRVTNVDDDSFRYLLTVLGYNFVSNSSANYYALDLKLGLCSRTIVRSTTTSQSQDAPSSKNDSSSESTTSTSSTQSTTFSQSTTDSNSTSASSGDSESSEEIQPSKNDDTNAAIAKFMNSLVSRLTCNNDGRSTASTATSYVCALPNQALFRLILQNFQNCDLMQQSEQALDVRQIALNERRVQNTDKDSAAGLSARLAVVLAAATALLLA